MAAPRKNVSKKKSAGKPAKPAKTTRAVSGKGAGKVIDAYVERCNPALKNVASAVRRLIRKAVPASAEAVNPWGVPTFELQGPFCVLIVGKHHVTLGFALGTSLPDPAKLLEGTGKNMRHVKLTAPEQVKNPHLHNLLLEAAFLNSKAPMNSGMRAPRRN